MIVLERLKDYCENSTIHGLSYLTEERRHFFERIFWLAAVCISTVGMYILAKESWDNFVTHPASFVTDTNYLAWNTSFPSVSVCERMDGNERIVNYMKNNQIDVTELLYISTVTSKPDDCVVCDVCNNETKINCPEIDEKLIYDTRHSCKELFAKCLWNDTPFECCANFMLLMTEVGPCFTINSLLARPKPFDPKVIDLTSNMKTGPGGIKLFVVEPVDVYLHGPEEVPYRNHPQDMLEKVDYPALTNSILFKLVEIENDPELRSLSVDRRGCRFREELPPNSPYPVYSYSTCIVECRMNKQLELCNCTTVFMTRFPETPVCTPLELYCLFQNAKALRVIKPPWKDAPGLACDCPLGCSELEITKIWSSEIENPDPDSDIKLVIKMASLPSERYQRNVVTTKLDLVVSLGGTAGLFLGASLLSGVEVLIYMLVRSCTRNKRGPPSGPSSGSSSGPFSGSSGGLPSGPPSWSSSGPPSGSSSSAAARDNSVDASRFSELQ